VNSEPGLATVVVDAKQENSWQRVSVSKKKPPQLDTVKQKLAHAWALLRADTGALSARKVSVLEADDEMPQT